MDIRLKTSGRIVSYDVQTKFATSALAPGMKALCQHAIENGGRLDTAILEEQYALSQAASRNLFTSGLESGVWDQNGMLTDAGHETAKTGEILLDEVGPLRLWTFDHETTGSVLLHAERLGLLPPADAEPTSGNTPLTLIEISNQNSSKSIKKGDKRRWRLQYTEKESAWALQEKFCEPATLSWSWKYDDEWSTDQTISLNGSVSGASRKGGDAQFKVNQKYPHTGALKPELCINKWLTKGRFSSGPWDPKLKGLKRPFAELNNAEKSMQTTDEKLDGEIEGWDHISIREIPLFAKTLEDACEWVIHLINEETPGYTTTESTTRKLGDILERPFMSHNSEKVRTRVEASLASNRSDPRLSKLLHAGDDLDATALIPEWVTTQKRNELQAEYDGSGDYDEFVKQISLNMKGQIQQVLYIDRYTHTSNYRRQLARFSKSISAYMPEAGFEVVTAHTPFTKHHEDQKKSSDQFKSKLLEFCDDVHFMEDTAGKIPHDRVIILRSDSETRCWCLTFGITATNRSVPAMRVDEQSLEPSLLNHLKVTLPRKEAQS